MACLLVDVGWKARAAKKLAIDTSLPKMARPGEVHIFKPPKDVLGRRAKFEKKARKLEAEKEAAEAKAREAAMHPHIIKAHHFFPKGKKGAHAKILAEAKKARKELSGLKRKIPSFVKSQSFDDSQGARKRDDKDVAAKLIKLAGRTQTGRNKIFDNFKKELQIMCELKHPRVVGTYGAFESGDVLGGVLVYFTDYGHRWHLHRRCLHLRRAAAVHTTRTIISRSAPLCKTCTALWAAPRFV